MGGVGGVFGVDVFTLWDGGHGKGCREGIGGRYFWGAAENLMGKDGMVHEVGGNLIVFPKRMK